ncbi:MAG: hypothetical protein VW548_01745 [Methylotenera sp.]
MKYGLLISLMLLSSCAQLMNGAEQPVMQYRDINTYKTTCSGAAEDWGSCARKAKKTCPNGYDVVEKIQDGYGAIRGLIFSCKK